MTINSKILERRSMTLAPNMGSPKVMDQASMQSLREIGLRQKKRRKSSALKKRRTSKIFKKLRQS